MGVDCFVLTGFSFFFSIYFSSPVSLSFCFFSISIFFVLEEEEEKELYLARS
jgi:hypothetical protein